MSFIWSCHSIKNCHFCYEICNSTINIGADGRTGIEKHNKTTKHEKALNAKSKRRTVNERDGLHHFCYKSLWTSVHIIKSNNNTIKSKSIRGCHCVSCLLGTKLNKRWKKFRNSIWMNIPNLQDGMRRNYQREKDGLKFSITWIPRKCPIWTLQSSSNSLFAFLEQAHRSYAFFLLSKTFGKPSQPTFTSTHWNQFHLWNAIRITLVLNSINFWKSSRNVCEKSRARINTKIKLEKPRENHSITSINDDETADTSKMSVESAQSVGIDQWMMKHIDSFTHFHFQFTSF